VRAGDATRARGIAYEYGEYLLERLAQRG